MLRQRQHAVRRIIGQQPSSTATHAEIHCARLERRIRNSGRLVAICDMDNFRPATTFYLYSQRDVGVQTVPIAEVRPPERSAGVVGFHKNRLAPILLAFTSDRCALPAVPVRELADGDRHRYEVLDGYHRYYASIAAGYTRQPVLIRSE
jgi:hypothetical protein